MPSTYSANLKIELQATGENAGIWGAITNANLGTALEQAIVGYAAATFPADADLTLTYADTNAAQTARALVLTTNSSVSLSATRNLIVPAIQKQYVVQNGTTGGQSIVVKTPTGTGITVPNGRKAHLYVDGTNVVVMDDYIPAGSNNSYAIAPNLLVGTTTNFSTTSNPGAIASVGRGKYTIITGTTGSGDSTLTVEGVGFAYQPPLIVATGSTSDTNFYNDGNLSVWPRLNNNGTGGTNRVTLIAIRSEARLKGTAANAAIQAYGVYGSGVRADADDISTATGNTLYGVVGLAGHSWVDLANKPNIYTGNSFALLGIGAALSGRVSPSGVSMNVLAGVATQLLVTSSTSSGSTEVNNVARHWGSNFNIGTTSGPTAVVTNAFGLHMPGPTIAATGTVANYYGVYLTAPTVTGTLTNRWAIYSLDASSPSYFAGNLGIGTASTANAKVSISSGTHNLELDVISATSYVTSFDRVGLTWKDLQIRGLDVILTSNGGERARVKSTGQVRFVPLAAAPSGAENGDVYYDSTTNKLRVYAGGVWTDLH